MKSDIEKVVRIYGNEPSHPKEPPQALTLPSESPTTDEITNLRYLYCLTQKKAADLCGVNVKTWRRWERGINKMPKSTWGWLRVVTSGAMVAGGPEWEGWNFYQGKLYKPDGRGGFTPGDLRSWPYVHAQLYEQRSCIRKLKTELEQLKKPVEMYERDKAVGQLDTLGVIAAQLMTEYQKSDDLLLQKLSNNLYDALKDIVSAQVPLIKAVTNNNN